MRRAARGEHPYAEIVYDDHPASHFVPVLAVQDGVITYAGGVTIECAGKKVRRYSIALDHPGGWSTRYGDLEHMFSMPVDRFAKRRKQRVRAGDVLGYASRDPVHVGFELWRCDDEGCGPVDPAKYLRDWLVRPWSDTPDQTKQPTAA
ncbi:MAG: M23 family metallopeptidase [Deltaproteobacteria bacterium]|nr:M23 family metallopeptidase [Deltaproteobacteria bacterium]